MLTLAGQGWLYTHLDNRALSLWGTSKRLIRFDMQEMNQPRSFESAQTHSHCEWGRVIVTIMQRYWRRSQPQLWICWWLTALSRNAWRRCITCQVCIVECQNGFQSLKVHYVPYVTCATVSHFLGPTNAWIMRPTAAQRSHCHFYFAFFFSKLFTRRSNHVFQIGHSTFGVCQPKFIVGRQHCV